MKTLSNFLNAYQHMHDTVMVPSRLKDITVTVTPVTLNANTTPALPVSATHDEQLVLPSASDVQQHKQNVDLYNCYQMLRTFRDELVGQTMTDINNNVIPGVDLPPDANEEADDEPAEPIASAFRQHLQGLFNILHQLTETANVLSKKYQDDIGEHEEK